VTSTRKIVLRSGAVVAALVVLLMVGGVAVVRSGWFREKVRLRIISEVERATGGRVEVRGFRFAWERLEAEVDSFVLHGKEPPGEPPLFKARLVRVGLKIVSLLDRDIDIASAVVVEPRVRIVVYEGGGTNLPRPAVARGGKSPVEKFLALAIRQFRIENGLVEINERRVPLDVRGENLTAHLSYERAGPRYSGAVSVRQLHLTPHFATIPPMDADFSVALEGNRLSIGAGRFATAGSAGQGTASVENLLAPRVSASFEARLSLKELLKAVKSPAAGSGNVQVTGKYSHSGISSYLLTARASGRGLSVQAAGARVGDVGLTSDVEVRPGLAALRKLVVSGLGGAFTGEATIEKSRRFHVTGETRGLSIPALAHLRGIEAGAWNGTVSGPVDLAGELAGGRARGLKARADLSVEASATERPVAGEVNVLFDQQAGTLELRDSHLATAATKIRFDGTLERSIRATVESTDLGDILVAASLAGAAAPKSLPVALKGGVARFSGAMTGKLEEPRVSGHVSVTNFVFEGRQFERLEADIEAASGSFQSSKFALDRNGARLEGRGRVALVKWKSEETSAVAGSFSVRGLSLESVLAEAGSKVSARGMVSGSFQLTGSIGAPQVSGTADLAQAVAYGEKLAQVQVGLRYEGRSLRIEPIRLTAGNGRVEGSVEFAHEARNWKQGALRFKLSGKGLRISQARAIAGLPEDVDGDADLEVEGEVSTTEAKPILRSLAGTATLRKLVIQKKPAGELRVTAATKSGLLTLSVAGEGAGMRLDGQARCKLQGDYAVEGEGSFTKFALSSLRPWLLAAYGKAPPLEAIAEGKLTFAGRVLGAGSWKGRLELSNVEIRPETTGAGMVLTLRSTAPVVVAISRKEAAIENARFTGTGTSLEGGGTVIFGGGRPEYDLRLRGEINLQILQSFNPNVTAVGESDMDITVRGPLARPEIYGQMQLKQASLNLRGIPNGIEGANGKIFFSRDRATIENLTARTGGGTLRLDGWAGFGGERAAFGLQAVAKQVRVRYPEGVSTTFDATLEVRGTTARSLLSGTATVLRYSMSPSLDFGSLVSRPSPPMLASGTQSDLLRGMQLDVKVDTARNARLESALTRDIQAEANLTIRGTPYKPVLLGRVVINQGEINFLGNRYRLSRGEIAFVNSAKLEPILNLDLYTRVRGIDVTMTFTGPPDRLNVTYRSDPPLQTNEIIPLLAVGRAPTSDPALLARRNERDQSWQQIGASSVMGTVLDSLEGGRLQRFFGVSRIKIDPKLTGVGNTPEAQLTIEQQVSKNITFTYVSSFAQEQQQLFRLEWNVSRQWSLLAVRDENGLFGVEFQFKTQFK
jgi:translocation and assembly module TamB